MAHSHEPNRKRAYADQQEFARNPPTAEDNYFREEDERKLHPPKVPEAAPRATGPAKPPTLFDRLYRAIARTFDPDWRP